MKDAFEQFREYRAPWAAMRCLKRCTTTAMRSRLAPLKRFVQTASSTEAGFLAFIGSRVTNAVAAGINRNVRIVKNRASGFRNLDAVTDLIHVTVGDVDTPARMPP